MKPKQTKGYCHQAGLTLIELLVAMAILSMLLMVALPAFTDYMVRAKLTGDINRVAEMKLRVIEYHLLTGALPESNNDVGLDPELAAAGDYLDKFYIDDEPVPGTIKLVFDSTYGDGGVPALGENNELWFEPEEVNLRIVWDCTGGNLLDKYRPANCRGGGGADGGDDGAGKGGGGKGGGGKGGGGKGGGGKGGGGKGGGGKGGGGKGGGGKGGGGKGGKGGGGK